MLTSTTPNKITYVKTMMGKFVTEVPEGTPGAIARVKKSGVKVHELQANELTGYIDQIEYKKNDWEGVIYRSLIIRLHSDAGHFQLELNLMGNEATTIFHVLPNIAPAHPVLFKIWLDKENKVCFVVYQHGQAVKWYYTKADPKGRPDWDRIETTDLDGMPKVQWDRSKQTQFFLNQLPAQAERFYVNWTKSQVNDPQVTSIASKAPVKLDAPEWMAKDPVDKLPF